VPVLELQLVLTAIRLVLGAAALAGAFLAGVERSAGGAGFAFGAGATALMLLTDRRSLLLGEPTLEPMPADAERETRRRSVTAGLYPSTVGVTLLAAASLAFEPVLSAVLAGVLAGMGVAGIVSAARIVLWERRRRARLYGEAGRGKRLFVAPR
jgi:hypothetical protein